MHGLPLSHSKNQKDFATYSPKREIANELDDEMSEIELLKAGEMIEPIVFEPKRKIRLSRSTHKVNSYIDFRPYQNSFKKFETYLHRFSRDLWDPDYVGALVNMNRFKEENYEYILKRKKSYFGPTTCREATYNCRVKKQYMRIVFETKKLKQLFNKIFEKFLKAINHMEFHPTLGKEKKGTSYRLHRCSAKDRDDQYGSSNEIPKSWWYWDAKTRKWDNSEEIPKVKQHKAQNKEIWFGYLDFRLGNI